MIQNVVKSFGFTTLDEEKARETVTRWLQNVLNLPVYLETESARAFCSQANVTTSDLIRTADDLDINIAIVDELLQRWYDAKTMSGEPGEKR
jgi:hypothetical protein